MKNKDANTGKDAGKVLGDINPKPEHSHDGFAKPPVTANDMDRDGGAMSGGSREGDSHRSGSRDVSQGTTGGLAPEVGGSRNFRTTGGATGMDIGKRPE